MDQQEAAWTCVLELKGHHLQGINDVAWSAHSKWLCSGSDDACVLVWDIEALLSTTTTSTAANATDTADATNTATHSNNPDHLNPKRVLKGHSSYVFCVTFNPSCTLVASGSFDESIKIWDLIQGTCHRTIPAHSDPVSCLNFSSDGTLLVSASFDGLIRIWDSYNGQCLKTLVDNNTHAPMQVCFL